MDRMSDLASRVNAKLNARDYLMKGDSGEAVKNMQTMLIALGYSCGTYGADSQFGDATESALKKFQKAKGLAVDGLYGAKSKAALTDAYMHKDGDKDDKDVIYRVQCGAFKTKANADNRVKALKAQGFTSIIKFIDGVYKVQCGAYKKKENAEALVKKLKAKGFASFVTT